MTLHVVGAGLAGLSCALTAADAGLEVVLHESTDHAGGRCRSWVEPTLDRLIDNGTHMVVAANKTVFRFLNRIGSPDGLAPGPKTFAMIDLASGERWVTSPLRLAPSILASLGRMMFRGDRDIASCLGGSSQYRRFWQPLAVAVMNTPAEAASAKVFRRVLAKTLWRSAAASRPFFARHGLSEAFIQPALTTLEQAGAQIRLQHALRRVERTGKRVDRLIFDDGAVELGQGDSVVIALPWVVARSLLPELPELPTSPIVNAHFRVAVPPTKHFVDGALGIIGGTAEWLFLRDDVISVTISAAAKAAEQSVDSLTQTLWEEICKALEINDVPLASRIIKEKRATIFHTPEVERLRPQPRAGENLVLAGDWTATGLPCTIEGALLSGERAAQEVLAPSRPI